MLSVNESSCTHRSFEEAEDLHVRKGFLCLLKEMLEDLGRLYLQTLRSSNVLNMRPVPAFESFIIRFKGGES